MIPSAFFANSEKSASLVTIMRTGNPHRANLELGNVGPFNGEVAVKIEDPSWSSM
jgi:hypothetical protein